MRPTTSSRQVSNKSDIGYQLYKKIYEARSCKVVCLSGTPVVNSPHEIAFLMNLLRGPIERIIVPFKEAPTWDEEKFKTALKAVPDVDTIEFNTVKKYLMLTRNPPNFRSVYNEKGERVAVQYVADMVSPPVALDWVKSWKSKFETDIGGGELDADRVTTEMLECMPSDYDQFESTFLDGLNIKNPLLFQRRIQGLVSYFKGADERLLPRRVDDEHMLEKVEMSSEQFNSYLETRWSELKADANRRQKRRMDEDLGSVPCQFSSGVQLRDSSRSDPRECSAADARGQGPRGGEGTCQGTEGGCSRASARCPRSVSVGARTGNLQSQDVEDPEEHAGIAGRAAQLEQPVPVFAVQITGGRGCLYGDSGCEWLAAVSYHPGRHGSVD
jgi:hypothetical protein